MSKPAMFVATKVIDYETWLEIAMLANQYVDECSDSVAIRLSDNAAIELFEAYKESRRRKNDS